MVFHQLCDGHHLGRSVSPALQRYGLLNDMYCLAKLLQQRTYKDAFLKSCLEEIADKLEVFYYDSKKAKQPYESWYTNAVNILRSTILQEHEVLMSSDEVQQPSAPDVPDWAEHKIPAYRHAAKLLDADRSDWTDKQIRIFLPSEYLQACV